MISKAEAKELYEYYDRLIKKLTEAKIALIDGGVKSYTIDGRSLTRFDLTTISGEIDAAVNKRAMYEAIMNGRSPRKAVGVVPRDI